MIKGNFLTSIPINKDISSSVKRKAFHLPLLINKSHNKRNKSSNDNSYVSKIDISSIVKQDKNILRGVSNQKSKLLQADISCPKNKFNKIENLFLFDFLKDKCYEDFDEKFRHQMKEKENLKRKDTKIMYQLGQMKKVVNFWTAFCDYVSPKISGQIFHYSRKEKDINDMKYSLNPNRYIKSKSLTNLYSNSKSVRRVFHAKVLQDESNNNR